jgi:hypothetical protein
MTQYDNELSGTLGRNTYKDSEKQPDFRGNCVIKGDAYKISGWIREGKNGKFFSLSFSPKEQPKSESFNPTQDFDEDIPF